MGLGVGLLLLLPLQGWGQSRESLKSPEWSEVSSGESALRPLGVILGEYVAVALSANLALRSQSFDVERELAVLAQARSQFSPQLGLEAAYLRASGGRIIEFPGVEFQIVREREQDTRLTLRQPLFAPAIPAAFRAQQATLDSSQFAREALARRLERDVTVGYLDWLRTRSRVAIVSASVDLLQENLRVNTSLYTNGRVTEDQVLRARAELLQVQQQREEAINVAARNRQLVNFFLNRALDEPLELASPASLLAAIALEAGVETLAVDALAQRAGALERRPEVAQQAALERAAGFQVEQQLAARQPQVSLGLNGGIQGEDYGTGSGYNFSTAFLHLTLPLFDGGAIRGRVAAARALARQASVRREASGRQIELEVQLALDGLRTAADSLATALAREVAARAGFRIASRKRDFGAINQVVFLDARNTLTSAELNLSLTRFELLARRAELDYATAAQPLPLLSGALSP